MEEGNQKMPRHHQEEQLELPFPSPEVGVGLHRWWHLCFQLSRYPFVYLQYLSRYIDIRAFIFNRSTKNALRPQFVKSPVHTAHCSSSSGSGSPSWSSTTGAGAAWKSPSWSSTTGAGAALVINYWSRCCLVINYWSRCCLVITWNSMRSFGFRKAAIIHRH